MVTPHGPGRGSLQFWPRVRAKRIYPRISFFCGKSLSAFAAYKVGMVQYSRIEIKGINKGKEIIRAATVLEVPPLYPIAIVFYKKIIYEKKKIGEYFNIKELPKEFKKDLKRKIKFKNDEYGKIVEDSDEIRLKIATFPRKTKLKKKPEIFEVGFFENLEKAKELLGKEIKIENFFSEGEYIDVTAITKGKGTQGVIKRFGVKLREHKSKKGRRRVGSIGSTTPRKVDWRVPMPGQMGFHQRTDYNKLILKISDKLDEINPKGGFKDYGFVNTKYILVDGSIPGPRKRLIILRKPKKAKKEILQINEIIK
ncbi:MAG TPA: 50S ribosomal protein L3 [Candidatus Aenigmarchaeota archaeon]|nr:50S ribosomal protein L3 [Candidatus Aenigmarchaeota archaeon]